VGLEQTARLLPVVFIPTSEFASFTPAGLDAIATSRRKRPPVDSTPSTTANPNRFVDRAIAGPQGRRVLVCRSFGLALVMLTVALVWTGHQASKPPLLRQCSSSGRLRICHAVPTRQSCPPAEAGGRGQTEVLICA
jgi:hypothetical protein